MNGFLFFIFHLRTFELLLCVNFFGSGMCFNMSQRNFKYAKIWNLNDSLLRIFSKYLGYYYYYYILKTFHYMCSSMPRFLVKMKISQKIVTTRNFFHYISSPHMNIFIISTFFSIFHIKKSRNAHTHTHTLLFTHHQF